MAGQNTNQQAAIKWYGTYFEKLERTLNGEASSRLHSLRKEALEHFNASGFPTRMHEEWKYTDVSALAKAQFVPVIGKSIATVTSEALRQFTFGLDSYRLVFENGLIVESLSDVGSLPKGVKIGSLAEFLRQDADLIHSHLAKYADLKMHSLAALNTAFLADGAFIAIPQNTILQKPIHIIQIATETVSQTFSAPRLLVIAGQNSESAIVESHVSATESSYFASSVSEIVLEENARVELDTLQMGNAKSFHISTTRLEQARNSSFVSNVITLGGALVRNDAHVVLNGEGAEATLNGLYLGTGNRHIDNHTIIEHAKPHCPSHELYKGILAGTSRGVFNGKIMVRKDAQKTDAKQTNKNLILSKEASVDTKPQLEIFANDVKCTHGATIGQLDDEAMFYLRSRGIDQGQAKDMLIYAFASDVINRVRIEPLREQLQKMINDQLEEERSPQ